MVNVLLLVMPIIFTANDDDQDMCVVFSFCFNVTSIQYLDQFRIISWKSFALAYFLCCINMIACTLECACYSVYAFTSTQQS